MTVMKHSTVVGVFHDRDAARNAVNELRRAGFREDQVGMISRDGGGTAPTVTGESGTAGTGSKWEEGAATGAAAGAGVGALWALGIAAGVLPAVGPIVAGGLLASVLASAAGGAAVAGIVGALIGLGVPEDEAKYYEGEFHSGRTLVTVQAPGRFEEAEFILRRHGAYNVNDTRAGASSGVAATSGSVTAPASAAAGTMHQHGHAGAGGTVELREEQLHARKTPVETGEVRVHKDVVTEQKTVQVPVEREEVVIERRPASGAASPAGAIREGEEIRIPVKEEQVRVEKTPVVTEEVSVGKRQVTENQQVSGTVRKEELRVEQEGDVNVRRSGDATEGNR